MMGSRTHGLTNLVREQNGGKIKEKEEGKELKLWNY